MAKITTKEYEAESLQDTVSTKEAAEYLRMSVDTVRAWIRSGQMAAKRRKTPSGGLGAYRIEKRELVRVSKEMRVW